MKKINMLDNHPAKTLFFFALPMIIGNLFQQFYNLIDSAVVGKFVGENALASVGASYAVTNVFIAIAIGGGIGSSVIISQHLGAGNIAKMKTAVYTALMNFLCVSVILGIFGVIFNRQILLWMDTPTEVFADAQIYLQIYFYGLPFLFMYNILASIFNAMGDSKTPLYLLIFSSVFNVILDLVFVISFGKGVAGVAVATLVAQGISAVISFGIMMRRLRSFHIDNEAVCHDDSKDDKVVCHDDSEDDKAAAKAKDISDTVRIYDGRLSLKMVRVAIPSILQQSIVFIGMLLVQVVVNRFGSASMAGFTAGMRIETICIVPMIAIGNAMSAFTAQNLGARKVARVRQGYKFCFMMVLIMAVIILALIQLFGQYFVGLFLDAAQGSLAYEIAMDYVLFQSFFYVLIGLKSISDGVLRGAGDMTVFTLANLANLGIRVFIAFAFAPVWGISAVWIAVPIGWGINFVISGIRYLIGKWSRIELV